jgi:hypothetical protein
MSFIDETIEEYQQLVKRVAQSADCAYAVNSIPFPHGDRPVYSWELRGYASTLTFGSLMYPSVVASHRPAADESYVSLFIGQVPFGINPARLQAVLETVSGAPLLALRPHIRKDGTQQLSGSWFADVRAEDAARLTAMNRRILFRAEGVDIFSDSEELYAWLAARDAVVAQCQIQNGFKQRKCLLAMVIECQGGRPAH